MSGTVPDFGNSKKTNNIALPSRAKYGWMPSREVEVKKEKKCKQRSVMYDKIYGSTSKVQLSHTERMTLSLEYEKGFMEEMWGSALKVQPELSGSQK